jgi:O-methyltransferase involved in polyketide biosynthesis
VAREGRLTLRRRQLPKAVQGGLRLPSLPAPWSVDAYVGLIAGQRQREIVLRPIAAAPDSALCGLLVSTEERDHIGLVEGMPQVLRDHTVLHELAHLILGHRGTQGQHWAALHEDTDSRYGDADERAAELLATAIAAAAGPPSGPPVDEPVRQRGAWAGVARGKVYSRLRKDLEPLWQMLAEAMPGIVLERQALPFWPLGGYRRLYRTVVEIHDGLRLLRPHIEPAAFDDLRRLGLEAELDDGEADAFAVAGMLDAATRALGNGALVNSVGGHTIPASLLGPDVVTDAYRLGFLARAVKHWPVMCPSRRTAGSDRAPDDASEVAAGGTGAAKLGDGSGRASVARAYDYLLGGKSYSPIDQALAEQLARQQPLLPVIARANRAWLERVVDYLLYRGVRQFLDIGSGIPAVGHIHELAPQGARVVYLDVDPAVVREGERLLQGRSNVAIGIADLAKPDELIAALSDPAYARLLNRDEPIGLILGAVLPFLADEQAYPAVRRLRSWLPNRGYVALSHATPAMDAEPGDTERQAIDRSRKAIGLHLRTPQEIARFLDGLDIEPYGLMPLTSWGRHPQTSAVDGPDRTGIIAGVGQKLYSQAATEHLRPRRPSAHRQPGLSQDDDAAADHPFGQGGPMALNSRTRQSPPSGQGADLSHERGYNVRPSSRIDITTAHNARVWDYWLGGKDNYQVDREVGDRIRQMIPHIDAVARADRAFLARAVTFLAQEAGIRQFLDIGTGLPTANNTHQVAQQIASEARVVYVDNDPVVLVHAQALLVGRPEGATDYIEADVRDPDTILVEAARTLDFQRPIALMLLGVLNFVQDTDEVQTIIDRLVDALPPGSYVAFTHPTTELGGEANVAAMEFYNQHAEPKICARTGDQIAHLFERLELVEPGLVSCATWRAEPDEDGRLPQSVPQYGLVARLP